MGYQRVATLASQTASPAGQAGRCNVELQEASWRDDAIFWNFHW
jgi:hypothetical protein